MFSAARKCFHCLAVFLFSFCVAAYDAIVPQIVCGLRIVLKEKDSVPTAVTIPVAPTVVNAAASTTTLTTTSAGTVSSTAEVRERRRCVQVIIALIYLAQ